MLPCQWKLLPSQPRRRQLLLQGIKEKGFRGGCEEKQAPANTLPMSPRSGPIGEITDIRKDQDSPRKGLKTFWIDAGHRQGIIQLETRRGSFRQRLTVTQRPRKGRGIAHTGSYSLPMHCSHGLIPFTAVLSAPRSGVPAILPPPTNLQGIEQPPHMEKYLSQRL